MALAKVNIENYKCFQGKFSIDFYPGINVLVGDNETGKSTILEAVNLALSGILNGRYLSNELSQYLFNHQAVLEYVASLAKDEKLPPPSISIEVFFSDDYPLFEGNGNSEREKACGVVLRIEFDQEYKDEYAALLSAESDLRTIPLEYYKVTWKSFARQAITRRSIPVKSVLIDSTSTRYQNGSDVYISQIIRDDMDEAERIGLSQAYRNLQQAFVEDAAVKAINSRIGGKSKVSDKELWISVDLSPRNSWETNLMTYLDKTPFHQIGKGEQCVVKTNLALGHKRARDAHVLLVEEPENHLSHARLNRLMQSVIDGTKDKQVIMTTHSSFVANKLGLEHLVLLNASKSTRLTDLSKGTYTFFKKLPGYQTLRLILCHRAVLVEGDSDELVFQRAYMDVNEGRLPIQDGIDVIGVGLSFKRFLDIARLVNQPVAVVTDNDWDYQTKIVKKYEEYAPVDCINIFADNRDELNTLEPQFVDANKEDLTTLRKVLGLSDADYSTSENMVDYMLDNKTKWALKVFEAKQKIVFPEYIRKAVAWCNGE